MLALMLTTSLLTAPVQDLGNPLLDRGSLEGDSGAIEFLLDVVDRRMYHLPGAGMKRACVSMTVPEVKNIAELKDFEMILLWQLNPRMNEVNVLGLPEELVREDPSRKAQLASLKPYLSTCLLRAGSTHLNQLSVKFGSENGPEKVHLQFAPKAGQPKTFERFERWYTPDGRLLKEKKVVPNESEGFTHFEVSYDMVEREGQLFLRSVDQSTNAKVREVLSFQYTKNGRFHVISEIHRRVVTPDEEASFHYQFDYKINDQVTLDDLRRARGQK